MKNLNRGEECCYNFGVLQLKKEMFVMIFLKCRAIVIGGRENCPLHALNAVTAITS